MGTFAVKNNRRMANCFASLPIKKVTILLNGRYNAIGVIRLCCFRALRGSEINSTCTVGVLALAGCGSWHDVVFPEY